MHSWQGAELAAQRQPPGVVLNVALRSRWQRVSQPQRRLGGEISLRTGGMFRIELIQGLKPWQGQQPQPLLAEGGGGREELLRAELFFFDQGIGLEAAGEDLAGVAQHLGLRFSPRAAEAIAKASDQAGQIRALGPIEGVELIHHQVAEHTGGVVGPEPCTWGRSKRWSSCS